MTPTQKLDLILSEVVKHKKGITLNDLYDKVNPSSHITMTLKKIEPIILGHEIERVILKLLDDKHISFTNEDVGHLPGIPQYETRYFSTFDGELFEQKGGYKQQKEDDDLKRWLKYIQVGALIVFSASTATWAAVQIYDRFSACCGCHH